VSAKFRSSITVSTGMMSSRNDINVLFTYAILLSVTVTHDIELLHNITAAVEHMLHGIEYFSAEKRHFDIFTSALHNRVLDKL
jgi:hypothetical protein